MDYDEALKLLKGGSEDHEEPEGIAEWNRRRWAGEEIPALRRADLGGAYLAKASLTGADLSEAYLSRAYLSRADLREADLSGAYLGGADLGRATLIGAHLTGANLTGANLSEADLHGADLTGANLCEADLRGTILAGADLSGADLSGANLSGADLSGADFTGARCSGTIFANVDMSDVKGLDSVEHRGPSPLSTDTLFRSQGKIPEAFLRGCGVPDALIADLPSLLGSMGPIQFHSCFISYSSQDQEFADRLYADLQAQGIRCWRDREDLKICDPIRPRIDEAIRLHDKLMLVLSENSLASPWVEGEVEAALEWERRQNQIVLFPVRLDDAVLDTDIPWAVIIRRARHIGDFRQWKDPDAYRTAFDRLLRDLKAEDSQ